MVPAAPPAPQVSTTEGMERGQWIRLFARSPLGTARRALLSSLGGRRAGVPQPQPAAASSAGGSRNSTQAGFLPLPQAFIEGQQQVLELGLDQDEHGASGVQTAVADGTLDAYLYGQNAVDSGSSKCGASAQFGFVGNGCCVLLLPPLMRATTLRDTHPSVNLN